MATGILLFLLWDVLVHGIEPVEEALTSATDGGGSWLDFVRLAAMFAAGAAIGLMSLVYYDRWFGRQRSKAMLGPGAASAAEFERSWVAGLSPAAWLALLIATGIGLHNFSEGLAIGQSGGAGRDQPRARPHHRLRPAQRDRGLRHRRAALGRPRRGPSWGFLLLLGLIGGGPTFVGTLLGQAWVNETVSVAFLALAAGSILYVVIELLNVNRQLGHKTLVAWMLLARAVPRLRDRLHDRSRRSLISLP